MNRIQTLALALTLSAASTAFADIPGVEVRSESLTITCESPTLPKQSDVGRVLGISNASAAYAARSHLMVSVRQACKGGDRELLVQRSDNQARYVLLAVR